MASNTPLSKLTDAQRGILSSAAGRADRLVDVSNPAGPSRRVVAVLIRRGFLAEVPVRPNRPHWRKDENDKPIGAKITADGMAALRADEPARVDAERPQGKRKQPAANAADAHDHAAVPLVGKPGTKQALIISLLRQAGGATLQDLMDATGWLPHTTRAALTGLRRKGLLLDKNKNAEGRTTYHIVSDAADRQQAA
jgi:Protein of unknown function (DUF3489)